MKVTVPSAPGASISVACGRALIVAIIGDAARLRGHQCRPTAEDHLFPLWSPPARRARTRSSASPRMAIFLNLSYQAMVASCMGELIGPEARGQTAQALTFPLQRSASWPDCRGA